MFPIFNTSKCFIHKLHAGQFTVNVVTRFCFTFKLNDIVKKFGSTYLWLIESDYFFTQITNHTAFILVTLERGDGVQINDFRVYASPSEWQTQWTLHLAVTSVGFRLGAPLILIKNVQGDNLKKKAPPLPFTLFPFYLFTNFCIKHIY